jgi:Ubiquitin family
MRLLQCVSAWLALVSSWPRAARAFRVDDGCCVRRVGAGYSTGSCAGKCGFGGVVDIVVCVCVRRNKSLNFCFLQQLFTVNVCLASAPPPTTIASVSVTLRGQKYEVSDVSTVGDLQEKVSTLSGIAAKQQGRVIFGGKRLSSDTVLVEAGVPTEGAHLNMVPSSSSTSSKKKKTAAGLAKSVAAPMTDDKAATSSGKGNNLMADLLKQSGIDSSALDEMMKSLGGKDGADTPDLEQGFKAMTEAMNSPLFKEMMSDPERLEQSRQMILANPMLKSMMSSMPGLEDILNDPVAWRQAMQAAAELYKNMDTETLMKAMMGGAEAAAANMPGSNGSSMDGTNGLFDGALSELDEDD